MNYSATIGLETHVQLKTRTKMFCACALDTASDPNTNVCPVCLGYPGALPVMNKKAVKLTVMTGMMLGCEINGRSSFDRKNYFYPDMAKNYQISQNAAPLCLGGGVAIEASSGGRKFVRINHIHLEEDAAKINHYVRNSGIDFNRGGTPLMEIVGEPDLSSADEAIAYLAALKEMLVYAGISDCNLEEGNMRSDVNISVRAEGQSRLGTKVEIKNMNTFRGIHAAIEYEVARQISVLSQGGKIVQETRRWDTDLGVTQSMRNKENAHDYRYFPEPDLVPVELSRELLEEWRREIPELPEARRQRMAGEYGLTAYDADVLAKDKAKADFFEAAAVKAKNPKAFCNLFMTDVMAYVNANVPDLSCAYVKETAPALSALFLLLEEGKINGPTMKELLPEVLGGKIRDPGAAVAERGLGAVSDASMIESLVDSVIAANEKSVNDYKAGKKAAMGFLVGQVMKLSKGKADPKIAGGILAKRLS